MVKKCSWNLFLIFSYSSSVLTLSNWIFVFFWRCERLINDENLLRQKIYSNYVNLDQFLVQTLSNWNRCHSHNHLTFIHLWISHFLAFLNEIKKLRSIRYDRRRQSVFDRIFFANKLKLFKHNISLWLWWRWLKRRKTHMLSLTLTDFFNSSKSQKHEGSSLSFYWEVWYSSSSVKFSSFFFLPRSFSQ